MCVVFLRSLLGAFLIVRLNHRFLTLFTVDTPLRAAGIRVIDVTDMNSAVDKHVVMITEELESFETEPDFSRIGRGVKLNTGIYWAAREKTEAIKLNCWIYLSSPMLNLSLSFLIARFC